jgi:hypothetical protein
MLPRRVSSKEKNELRPSSNSGVMTALSALIVLCQAPQAAAYAIKKTDSGEPVRWRREEVVLRFDRSLELLGELEEVEAMLESALGEWEETGLLDFDFGISETSGALSEYQIRGDRHNDVLALGEEWPFDERASAVTILVYDARSGDIIEADILFNATRYLWNLEERAGREYVDLSDTATHEFGHFLGLDHSEVRDATMFEESPLGGIARRTLHSDDRVALEILYDPSLTEDMTSQGCSFAPGPPRCTSSMALIFILGAVVIVVRLRHDLAAS